MKIHVKYLVAVFVCIVIAGIFSVTREVFGLKNMGAIPSVLSQILLWSAWIGSWMLITNKWKDDIAREDLYDLDIDNEHLEDVKPIEEQIDNNIFPEYLEKLKSKYWLINKTDEDIYEISYLEIENGNKKTGIWARSISESAGDEKKAIALYIKYRSSQLIDERSIQKKELSKELNNNTNNPKYCENCCKTDVYLDIYNKYFCPNCQKYVK